MGIVVNVTISFYSCAYYHPWRGFPGVFTGGSSLWSIGGGSITFFACEASCASSGAVPVIGTSRALSSADNGLFSTVGISPSISKASVASLISVDVAGVSTVFDLGADVSLVNGWGSMVGLGAASGSFLVFLFLTSLGRCIGFVVNLDLNLSAAIRCLDGFCFRSTSCFFLGGVGGASAYSSKNCL